MSYAMKEINELKNDTIEDQKAIVKLQQEVIGKKNEEIDGDKKTVTEELNSYGPILLCCRTPTLLHLLRGIMFER